MASISVLALGHVIVVFILALFTSLQLVQISKLYSSANKKVVQSEKKTPAPKGNPSIYFLFLGWGGGVVSTLGGRSPTFYSTVWTLFCVIQELYLSAKQDFNYENWQTWSPFTYYENVSTCWKDCKKKWMASCGCNIYFYFLSLTTHNSQLFKMKWLLSIVMLFQGLWKVKNKILLQFSSVAVHANFELKKSQLDKTKWKPYQVQIAKNNTWNKRSIDE